MTFREALIALQDGRKATRTGWNGKGMFLFYLQPATVPVEWIKDPILKEIAEENGGSVDCLGTIRMKTADGKVLSGWSASQSDMDATDWTVIG